MQVSKLLDDTKNDTKIKVHLARMQFVSVHRGGKTQNFPVSNFLRAKTFQTVSQNKPKKRMAASHNIVKECVINVLGL